MFSQNLWKVRDFSIVRLRILNDFETSQDILEVLNATLIVPHPFAVALMATLKAALDATVVVPREP